MSKAMLDDIAAQEAACKANVQHAQDKLPRLNPEAEIAKHQAALDTLQRRASTLRQVCLFLSQNTAVMHNMSSALCSAGHLHCARCASYPARALTSCTTCHLHLQSFA